MSHTLVCAATSLEITPFLEFLEKEAEKKNFSTYHIGGQEIQILITGVGPIFTAHALAKYFNFQKPRIAIHAGIAGGYNHLEIGSRVQVVQDRFADIGAFETDGSFKDVYEMELSDPNFFPFQNGWIEAPDTAFKLNDSVKKVKGITVSTVTGNALISDLWKQKYSPDIETMEGASFMYACLMDHVDFISIRTISNYVGQRDKSAWNLALAVDNLNESLIELVQAV